MHCIMCYEKHERGPFCPYCLAFLKRQRDIELGKRDGKLCVPLWPATIVGKCDFCRRQPCECRCNICGKLRKDCTCRASAILAYYGVS